LEIRRFAAVRIFYLLKDLFHFSKGRASIQDRPGVSAPRLATRIDFRWLDPFRPNRKAVSLSDADDFVNDHRILALLFVDRDIRFPRDLPIKESVVGKKMC
jgi:hypothetical protein